MVKRIAMSNPEILQHGCCIDWPGAPRGWTKKTSRKEEGRKKQSPEEERKRGWRKIDAFEIPSHGLEYSDHISGASKSVLEPQCC